ncbi:TetR/AcrR family transcriptional regulator [Jongsikchunia kroppenstedtii]|uniref:TetR/AcrR family transcriptional regulator n=1 Tax=Jongsikchunia kroppenstedtii TaxID=1121721 RepID=UPI00036BF7F0|nr:TetR/AcrR family transcriptional regulator [Jongsikchunia kroppenstedtii]
MGRPVDPGLSARIDEVTLRMLDESGYHGLTISGVAAAAGVPRSTLYRRGKTKAALVVSAISELVPPLRDPVSDDPLRDLSDLVVDFVEAFVGSGHAAVVMELHARAYGDPELAELVRRYLVPRGETVDAVLARAAAAGLLDRRVTPDMVRDLLLGPLLYRWLVPKEIFDRGTAMAMTEAVLRGIRA